MTWSSTLRLTRKLLPMTRTLVTRGDAQRVVEDAPTLLRSTLLEGDGGVAAVTRVDVAVGLDDTWKLPNFCLHLTAQNAMQFRPLLTRAALFANGIVADALARELLHAGEGLE